MLHNRILCDSPSLDKKRDLCYLALAPSWRRIRLLVFETPLLGPPLTRLIFLFSTAGHARTLTSSTLNEKRYVLGIICMRLNEANLLASVHSIMFDELFEEFMAFSPFGDLKSENKFGMQHL